MKRFASADDFSTLLRQALSGSRLQGNKIEMIGKSIISAAKPEEHWKAILDDLEKLAEHDPERDGAERRPEGARAARRNAKIHAIGDAKRRLLNILRPVAKHMIARPAQS